jgi:hypothetical protein
MNRPFNPNTDSSPAVGNTAGVVTPSPVAAPATHSCPQCDAPLAARFRDDDTGCFYPCDDGEGYCAECDSIWTIDAEPTWEEFNAPFKRLADGFLRVEL